MKQEFLFFVVGATNVGKSTFLTTIKDIGGGQVHLVEVGKLMRAKYPPEHFKGQASPAHTQKEALEMLFQGIEEGNLKKASIILVDGQPRDVGQAEEILGWRFQDHRTKGVIHLMCHRDERERRAQIREKNNPGALQLALDRLDRDVLQLHEVLITFDRYDRYNFNTGHPNYTPLAAFQEVLRKYGACLLGTNAAPACASDASANQEKPRTRGSDL